MEKQTFTSYKQLWILPMIVIFLFSCNAPTEQAQIKTASTERSQVQVPENTTEPITEEVIEQVQAVQTPSKKSPLKAEVYKDAEPVEHVAYKVNPKTIDSLNKIIPLYDTTLYSQLAVTYFTSLADSLHGRPFFTPDADSLLNSIMEIMSTRINDGTDIVFLIDKTGSMADDIEKVKKSMDLILDYLKNFNNIKVGIAEYGDKNWQYDFWYNSVELSNDIDGMKEFLEEYQTIGNPDVPESVNDAIVKTVTEMNWTDGNKRLMLVIGDAPSQTGPLSEFTQQQVIDKCDSMNVTFNLYPIIIGLSAEQRAWVDPFVQKDFLKTYPNPASDILNIEVSESGSYSYILEDITGKIIKQGVLTNKKDMIQVNDLMNGNYLFQIYDQSGKDYNTKMIVVQHN